MEMFEEGFFFHFRLLQFSTNFFAKNACYTLMTKIHEPHWYHENYFGIKKLMKIIAKFSPVENYHV